jgi:hypothetical protein
VQAVSAIGTKRTWPCAQHKSAIGCKADIMRTLDNVCNAPQTHPTFPIT